MNLDLAKRGTRANRGTHSFIRLKVVIGLRAYAFA